MARQTEERPPRAQPAKLFATGRPTQAQLPHRPTPDERIAVARKLRWNISVDSLAHLQAFVGSSVAESDCRQSSSHALHRIFPNPSPEPPSFRLQPPEEVK